MLPPQPPALEALADNILRLIAPNPSPMTYWGTNTYLIGTGDIAVIDPGPDDPAHIDAILTALPERARITHILVTHAHLDHSPGARLLSARCGAPVYAYGDAHAGQSTVMRALAEAGLAGGGEGVDPAFVPDVILRDGESIEGNDWSLTALHTPGHMGNHLAFAMDDILFCGDLVMGWSSSLVSPPDGDLTDFMASCRRLSETSWQCFYAGHGDPIETPNARLQWLIDHRMGREAQILETLQQRAMTARELAEAIYTDISPKLLPAAERNVFAHLVDLTNRAITAPQGRLEAAAVFVRK